MSLTPHPTLQLPIRLLDQIDLTHHQSVEGLLVVAVAVAVAVEEEEEEAEGDGLELQDQEQVPRHSLFLEATGKCMETPPEYLRETRPKPERSLENGIDTGASTISLTLCVFPTLAP